MTFEDYQKGIPAQLLPHLKLDAPGPARMMAAKGLVPLPPADALIVLCGLTLDADTQLFTTAKDSLAKMPDKLVAAALDQKLPEVTCAVLAIEFRERPVLLQKLLLRRDTPDQAIAAVAATVPAELAEIIAGNQERCLRSEAVVRAIAKNPNVLRSSLDGLFDFLVRSGVIYEEMPEFAESLARLSPQEMCAVADKIDLPSEVAMFLESDPKQAKNDLGETANDLDAGELDISDSILEMVPAEATLGSDEKDADKKSRGRAKGAGGSVHHLLATLNVAQKIALALRGNREVRTLLVRDANRVVATAAIRSPRLTEQEVISAAQSRSVSDDVVRIIGNSKDMSRSYAVKVALVNNPKTPQPLAMRFLTLLRQNDLRTVAKSKNVSTAVANLAKRMVAAKSGAGH